MGALKAAQFNRFGQARRRCDVTMNDVWTVLAALLLGRESLGGEGQTARAMAPCTESVHACQGKAGMVKVYFLITMPFRVLWEG